jgi:hypothetical protein
MSVSTIATNTESATLSIHMDNIGNISRKYELSLVPIFRPEEHVEFWVESVSRNVIPGRKYYFCPSTHEVSWKFPEGNIEIIPYLFPEDIEKQNMEKYLRVYSPPPLRMRKEKTN